MKRLIVIFFIALLSASAVKTEARPYLRYYHPYGFHYGARPFIGCRVYHRARVPGFWHWDWRCHRYFWINGY